MRGRVVVRATIVAAVLACGLAITQPVGAAPGDSRARAQTAQTQSATIRFNGAVRAIPRSFYGISLEYDELPRYEIAGPLFAHVISLIRPRDGSPMLLRVGGKSADHALWVPNAADAGYQVPGTHRLPHGVFAIDDTWLANLVRFVHAEDLRVILDMNLAVHSTKMESSFAIAARQALGGGLASLEIGNEPDEYHYQPRLTAERVTSTSRKTPLHWWNNYSPADYRRDYISYARALKRAVPGVRLGAPDIVGYESSWLSAVTGLGRLSPTFLAVHRYAGSTCFAKGSPGYPTISGLLSDNAGRAPAVTGSESFARAHHVYLRLTEVNSISCGARGTHVGNTFAAALWAPDDLLSMIEAGVSGVSWEIRPDNINSPFHFAGDGIQPLPELYGLALFAQLTRGPASLIASSISGAGGGHLRAWQVRRGGAVSVLLTNTGANGVNAVFASRPGTSATVRRMTAPSPRSTSGEHFAGMSIDSDGRWTGQERSSRVPSEGGFYHVFVGAYSAALITY